MKLRKVFLDGFVELKRELFKRQRGAHSQPVATIHKNQRTLRISKSAIELFGAEKIGEASGAGCLCSAMYNGKDFAIVEDDEGFLTIRNHETNSSNNFTICSVKLIELMKQNGYEPQKHYKVTSPEKGVLIIHRE